MTDYYFYCIIWLIFDDKFGWLLLCQLAKFYCVSWIFFIVAVGQKSLCQLATERMWAALRPFSARRGYGWNRPQRWPRSLIKFAGHTRCRCFMIPSPFLLFSFFVGSLCLLWNCRNILKINKKQSEHYKTTQKTHLQHLTPRPCGDPSTVSRQSLCIHTCIGGNLKTLFLSCRRKSVLLHLLLY